MLKTHLSTKRQIHGALCNGLKSGCGCFVCSCKSSQTCCIWEMLTLSRCLPLLALIASVSSRRSGDSSGPAHSSPEGAFAIRDDVNMPSYESGWPAAPPYHPVPPQVANTQASEGPWSGDSRTASEVASGSSWGPGMPHPMPMPFPFSGDPIAPLPPGRGPADSNPIAACRPDFMRFCMFRVQDMMNPEQLVQCMQVHSSDLAPTCRAFVQNATDRFKSLHDGCDADMAT